VTTYLVQGAEPVLRDLEAQRVVNELLAGEDRSFALDDHTIPARRRGAADDDTADDNNGADGAVELPLFAAITNALSSPPFMTANRVVVVREIGNLIADQARWLAGWMEVPLDDVHLVLVVGGGRTPSAIEKAVKAHGTTVKPKAEKTDDVLKNQLGGAHLKLTAEASQRVAAHLGSDAGRVPELVEMWHSTYGDGAVLDVDDVDQYLGSLGTAGDFELTNAIDKGDIGWALETLHRMMYASSAKAKPMHPMQIMGSLSGYYRRLLRLDDPSIVTADQAAEALGMSAGAARFRLKSAKQLGTDGLREAMGLLAQAELDLRGEAGLDEFTVTDVLVARLAALSRRYARSG
jgi:DNA polymerase III subunit delta